MLLYFIIVGDYHVVMVIPKNLVDDVANECIEMILFENYVIEKVNQGHSITGLYPLTNEKKKK